uniref:NADH-ubiquinone oxidoreductase chain 6 n=1 Tax=Arenivaga sp. B097 TaxID=2093454 RepID=A0A2P1H8R5_9NEOP|nr:NADH dehydrogenase subunit 6 [Arenivaga sp. B097]
MMMLMMSIMLSINFTQMKHPLAMNLILLIQTTLICMISGFMSQTFWFSYILFLIFIGGMLVLFIYITSLASNEMFYLSLKAVSLNMLWLPIMLLFLTPNNSWDMNLYNMSMNNEIIYPMLKLYNYPINFITITLALYLFLALIVVVKITNISEGPLRKIN